MIFVTDQAPIHISRSGKQTQNLASEQPK